MKKVFCLLCSLAWGLGVFLRTFSGLMTLFANTQVGMSGLVYKRQTLYYRSVQSSLSGPVLSPWIQAWVSASLPLEEGRKKGRKDALPRRRAHQLPFALLVLPFPPLQFISFFHVRYDYSTVSLSG